MEDLLTNVGTMHVNQAHILFGNTIYNAIAYLWRK